MKRKSPLGLKEILLLMLLLLPFLLSGVLPPRVIRVACVGDSITYGKTIPKRQSNSYPARLAKLLGPGYRVKNFGVNGACASLDSNKPYRKRWSYLRSLTFQPQEVFILLGTNDSKEQNWSPEAYWEGYSELIEAYQNLSSQPRVTLILPLPAFREAWGIRPSVIEGEILPLLKDLAAQKNLRLIDTSTPFGGREDLSSDGIHPNKEGAHLLAELVAQTLSP